MSLASLAVAASLLTVLLSLASFAGVRTSRRLPGLDRLTFQGVKPFACDSCYAAWWALAWAAALAWLLHGWLWVLLAPPAAGLSDALLRWADPPPPPELQRLGSLPPLNAPPPDRVSRP